MSDAARKPDPAKVFFLPGKAGRLLTLYRPPETPDKETLLIAPAFAEEMNKSRRMYTLLTDDLNRKGVGVLLLDLYGTGDSEGDFADARWDLWLSDLECALQWLQHNTHSPVSILGHRLGALLALDLIDKGLHDFAKLILWQPVTRGKNYLTQFLRLRMAASMLDSSQEKETTQQLRTALTAGQSIEVAGYMLHPELAQAMDTKEFVNMLGDTVPPVHWFDLSSQETPALSPASRKHISMFDEKGININSDVVRGDAFWSTAEIATAPALIDKTCEVFG